MALLEEKLRQYLEQLEIVKSMREELKDLTQNHPLYPEIQQKANELKQLRAKLNSEPEIAQVKEKCDTEKERSVLLREILTAEMMQAKQSEVTFEGRKAVMVSTMKIGREDQ